MSQLTLNSSEALNYKETLQFMYSQLPMYQRVGDIAFKKGLGNIEAYCGALRNPQKTFKSIHIGGTNGKGSSAHTLAAILQTAGYKVGLYTSPHLKNFTERIKINGAEIPQEDVVDFVTRTKQLIDDIKPSFFEMTVAMAFDYFARKQVDIAVIEVGLGGRLDSTNIIQPIISLITNIGYDHQQMLGETLPEIATEKAGIIKAKTPVIISEAQEEIAPIFIQTALEKQSPIHFAIQDWEFNDEGQIIHKGQVFINSVTLDLLGTYQKKNLLGVLQAASMLQVSKEHIYEGITNVRALTGLKGRWQLLGKKPLTYCDVGHNQEGVQEIMTQISEVPYRQLHIVWGMVSDKRRDPILALLPQNAQYYFCKPQVPRGYDAHELQKEAMDFNLVGETYPSVAIAIKAAQEAALPEDCIFIGGSTFVVAEIPDL